MVVEQQKDLTNDSESADSDIKDIQNAIKDKAEKEEQPSETAPEYTFLTIRRVR